ncbi:hypothetical protein K491DRAFT_679725 [Lophiostoma macrostomum CBS 122681]|uniref:Uncharacterized protein n=1 Tax=Lophiostoma macrostomum CBS 122681 TaxID=1314788 RepID=A0A6A6T3L1_9PLEO|nr:hypothetical protein K491DRAFT_679725 [Lophiostoma macrostomum CBS 122681]
MADYPCQIPVGDIRLVVETHAGSIDNLHRERGLSPDHMYEWLGPEMRPQAPRHSYPSPRIPIGLTRHAGSRHLANGCAASHGSRNGPTLTSRGLAAPVYSDEGSWQVTAADGDGHEPSHCIPACLAACHPKVAADHAYAWPVLSHPSPRQANFAYAPQH